MRTRYFGDFGVGSLIFFGNFLYKCLSLIAIQFDSMSEAVVSDELCSRQHVSAIASMVISQLPFPPMPVLITKNGEDTFCSSHDLMASAIAVNFVDRSLSEEHHMNKREQKVMEQKEKILTNLQRTVADICDREPVTFVTTCYNEFQIHFRAYMQFYPGSGDICFFPMHTVDSKHGIIQQACQHLRALGIQETASVCVTDHYESILCLYCQMLHGYDSAV